MPKENNDQPRRQERPHPTIAAMARLLLSAVLAALPLPATAQGDIAHARQLYAEVNAALPGMEREAFTAQRKDVEYRSDVKAWRDAGGVRKVEVTDLDDSGSVVTEYYFRAGRLVFAYVAVKGFDPQGREVTRIEQRQYFRDGRMVQWLGGMEKAIIPSTDTRYAGEAKDRISSAAFYREAAELAFARKGGSVRIGNATKRTTGRVIALTNADTACLMELEDAKGARFHESADFDICFQEPPLVGRRVALAYEMANVQSAECQGNPACRKTTRIPLVVAALPLDAVPAAAPKAVAALTSLCTPLEEPVFACRVGSKLVSVCASKDANRSGGYVQYRYGKPDSRDAFELELPAGRPTPPRAATGDSMPFAGGGAAWMRFRNGEHAYVVYTGIGKWGPRGETQERAGLVVERGGKAVRSLRCSGRETSLLGPDWFGKAGIEPRGEEFELPP